MYAAMLIVGAVLGSNNPCQIIPNHGLRPGSPFDRMAEDYENYYLYQKGHEILPKRAEPEPYQPYQPSLSMKGVQYQQRLELAKDSVASGKQKGRILYLDLELRRVNAVQGPIDDDNSPLARAMDKKQLARVIAAIDAETEKRNLTTRPSTTRPATTSRPALVQTPIQIKPKQAKRPAPFPLGKVSKPNQ